MNLRAYEKMALREVKLFIEEHYTVDNTVKDLSGRAWMVHLKGDQKIYFTPRRLHEAFKDTYAQTIYQYHTNLRMEKAKDYLLNSDLSIKSIAISLGYKGDNNFEPMFKKHFGLTPSEYRKRYSGS